MASVDKLDEEILDLLNSFTHRRIARVGMYFLLFVGSMFSIFAPSEILLQQSSFGLTRAWSVLFAIAAVFCFIGSMLDRWIVEYIMIPLLGSTLMVFGIALLSSAVVEGTGLIVPYAMFFGAFACGLFARWRDVQALLRVAVSLGREDKE